MDNISELAFEVIKSSTSVTGVQAKLALDINKGGRNEEDRLTIVGLWGGYILKPQSPAYKSMPELENATMNMAEASGIRTARHGLIRMSDGELAYITKGWTEARKDRNTLCWTCASLQTDSQNTNTLARTLNCQPW